MFAYQKKISDLQVCCRIGPTRPGNHVSSNAPEANVIGSRKARLDNHYRVFIQSAFIVFSFPANFGEGN